MFDFIKKMQKKDNDKKINIIMISAACCIPSMETFDKQARMIIDRAISETGIEAQITLVPATTAMFTFRKIADKLMAKFNAGENVVPAIIIDNELISYGVPQLEDMKTALKKSQSKKLINN